MALEGYTLVDDFGDAQAEARACRERCALFDFSFLECARVAGRNAFAALERFTGRPLKTLRENGIFYALRVDKSGAVRADLTIWRTGRDCFEVMSGRREDIADLLSLGDSGIEVSDMAERAVFALQGPGSLDALRKCGDVGVLARLGYFNFARVHLAGTPCTVGRLGYTGEAGFEIIAGRAEAGALWWALAREARPAGFVAADILRIEAGFVLYTNELGLPVAPAELGLGKFHASTGSFGPTVQLVAFRADAGQLIWPWRPVRDLRRPTVPETIAVTSACASIVAGGILGLGYVLGGIEASEALRDPTGTFRNIRITPMPFHNPAKRRVRAWR